MNTTMNITNVPTIDMAATGRNIYTLRVARGMSVADLQRFFGFDAPQAIYKWQNGKTLPSIDNRYALSYLFEVAIEDILIIQRPTFKVLPQEGSCGSSRFGSSFTVYFSEHMLLKIIFFNLITAMGKSFSKPLVKGRAEVIAHSSNRIVKQFRIISLKVSAPLQRCSYHC